MNWKSEFGVEVNDLTVTSVRIPRKGRWLKHPEREFLCNVFQITSRDMAIFLNENIQFAKPFDLSLEFETASVEAEDYLNHNPKVVDQSYKINIETTPIKLSLKQKYYTYLLNCIDLNINYTDEMTVYNFKNILNPELNGLKFKINWTCPSVSVKPKHDDGSLIAQILILGFDMGVLNYTEGYKDMTIKLGELYILHDKRQIKRSKIKKVLLSPLLAKNEITTNEEFFQDIQKKVSITIKLHNAANADKTWVIDLRRIKINLNIPTLMILANFFVHGLADYEGQDDQPNQCILYIYILYIYNL